MRGALFWLCYLSVYFCVSAAAVNTHDVHSRVAFDQKSGEKTKTRKIVGGLKDNSQDRRKIILFDGFCNFCNFWVDLLIRYDPSCKFRLCAIQTEKGRQLLQNTGLEDSQSQLSSVVLISPAEGGVQNVYKKSTAFLKVTLQFLSSSLFA